VRDHLAALVTAVDGLPGFDAESVEQALRTVAEVRGVKPATLIHAVRVALTGRTASPGLFDVAVLLGRQATTARLTHAMTLTAAPA